MMLRAPSPSEASAPPAGETRSSERKPSCDSVVACQLSAAKSAGPPRPVAIVTTWAETRLQAYTAPAYVSSVTIAFIASFCLDTRTIIRGSKLK